MANYEVQGKFYNNKGVEIDRKDAGYVTGLSSYDEIAKLNAKYQTMGIDPNQDVRDIGNQESAYRNKAADAIRATGNNNITGQQIDAYLAGTYTTPTVNPANKRTDESVAEWQARTGQKQQALAGTNLAPDFFTNSTTVKPAASATVTTGIQPKPNFVSKITNGTLTLGSRGDDVKELQTWLRDTQKAINADGTPLKVDGLYGPQTVLSIKKWQQDNELTADGIFGPKSLAAYNKVATTSATNANTNNSTSTSGSTSNGSTGSVTTSGNTVTYNGKTYNASSPEEAEMIQSVFDSLKAQNLAINPELNLGPDIIARILDKAKASVHPYYQDKITAIQDDIKRTAPQLAQEYGGKIEDANSQFQNDLGSVREDFSNRGMVFSGQRGKTELSMQSSQDRTLQGLNTSYGNKLYELGRTAEEKIGAGNMQGYNLPSLAQYGTGSTSLAGNGNINSLGTSSPYTPGRYNLGSLVSDETAAGLALRNQNVEEASRRKSAGLSYSDLYA